MIPKDEARNLYCPFKQGIIQCRAELCMGWEVCDYDQKFGYCRPLGKGKMPPKPVKAKPIL